MTTEQIKARIQEIRAAAGLAEDPAGYCDDERAHGLQDGLYLEFIRSIAKGNLGISDSELRKQAKLVASVDDIEFCRWCA